MNWTRGFVVSEAFEGDLYVHRRSNPDLGPLQSGDPVTFQAALLNLSWFQRTVSLQILVPQCTIFTECWPVLGGACQRSRFSGIVR